MRNLFTVLAVLFCTAIFASDSSKKASTAQANVFEFSMHMPQLNRDRTIRIYLPPDYDHSNKRYPVVYMHDGQNLFDDATSYVGEWGVDEILNELFSETRIGIIVVGIDHGGEFRINELKPFDDPKYGKGEGREYTDFIVQTLMPYIEKHYRVSQQKENTAMIGSSLGGLMTLYAAKKYPDKFGKLGIFSPAYWIGQELKKELKEKPIADDLRVYSIMGENEGDDMLEHFVQFNLQLKDQLSETNFQVIPNGEHNEHLWRKQFKSAMRWLYSDCFQQ